MNQQNRKQSVSSDGMVYLVGAGPGDPDLVTLKAIKALGKADVVVYDRLSNPELLSYAPDSAEHIYVGKKPGKPSAKQDQINAILISKARTGNIVVRLKGGDPFIFGRGGEECIALKNANLAYQVVPGISSSLSVPAYAGIPLTHRSVSRSVTIVTGHTVGKNRVDQDWNALSKSETLVILMGMRNMGTITRRLLTEGMPADTPAAVVQRGTHADQRSVTGTLSTITQKAADLASPGIIVIGETAKFADQLSWVTSDTDHNQLNSAPHENGKPEYREVAHVAAFG